MNRIILISCLFVCFAGSTFAQRALNGHWTGTITEGQEEYSFELYIQKQGRKLTALTFVHLNDSTTVEMEANGVWHDDRSFNLYDQKIVRPVDGDPDFFFQRNYQILFRRSFNDYHMEGWWQERRKNYNDKKRKLGRVYLKKISSSKA